MVFCIKFRLRVIMRLTFIYYKKSSKKYNTVCGGRDENLHKNSVDNQSDNADFNSRSGSDSWQIVSRQ